MAVTLTACIATLEGVRAELRRLQYADDDGSSAHLFIQDADDAIVTGIDNIREALREIRDVPEGAAEARARWSAGVMEAAE